MDRAKKGGQVGMNGEWYDGGQYLPNTTLGKQAPQQRRERKPRKVEIEPYVWVIAPEGMRSLYSQFNSIGKIINGKMTIVCKDSVLNYFHLTREYVQKMADQYNNGERWIKIAALK